MRFAFLGAVALAGGLATAVLHPVAPSGTVIVIGPKQFHFVGVTSTTVRGESSPSYMTALCAQEFPGSRMALSDEYLLTPNAPPIQANAWVRPHVTAAQDLGGHELIVDAAGNALPGAWDSSICWSIETSGVVRPVQAGYCFTTYAVACSAPMADP